MLSSLCAETIRFKCDYLQEQKTRFKKLLFKKNFQ
jgi:hypothetical protein